MVSETGIKDVYDRTQRPSGKLDAYTPPRLTIVPQQRVQAELVADLAGCYARQVAELGEMVRAEAARSTATSAVVSDSLRELETALRALVEAMI